MRFDIFLYFHKIHFFDKLSSLTFLFKYFLHRLCAFPRKIQTNAIIMKWKTGIKNALGLTLLVAYTESGNGNPTGLRPVGFLHFQKAKTHFPKGQNSFPRDFTRVPSAGLRTKKSLVKPAANDHYAVNVL